MSPQSEKLQVGLLAWRNTYCQEQAFVLFFEVVRNINAFASDL